MATKVSIVDVDLDISVDKIIAGNITQLTARNTEEIANAVEQSSRVQKLISAQQLQRQAKKAKEDDIVKLLATMEEKLLEGPIAAVDIYTQISEHITTVGAFTARMKAHLRNAGNKYALHKYTKHGCQYYTLIPFNVETPVEDV